MFNISKDPKSRPAGARWIGGGKQNNYVEHTKFHVKVAMRLYLYGHITSKY